MLTARTVEICESLGLGDELTNVAPPPETWRHFRYCDAVDGADFGAADHGAAPAWANLLDASEARVAHVSQPVFETLLREAVAEEPLVETRERPARGAKRLRDARGRIAATPRAATWIFF